MRKFAIVILAASAVTLISSAQAAITKIDISNQAGFQYSGAAGTAGNGLTFFSPAYTFDFGAQIDFGSAFVSPDYIDGRSGPCGISGFSDCSAHAGYAIYFLTNGVGGPLTVPFDLGDYPARIVGSQIVVCNAQDCPPIEVPLRFDLPDSVNGIQFLFLGTELTIVPPAVAAVPEPSTWAMMILGFAVVGLNAYRRRYKALTSPTE